MFLESATEKMHYFWLEEFEVFFFCFFFLKEWLVGSQDHNSFFKDINHSARQFETPLETVHVQSSAKH